MMAGRNMRSLLLMCKPKQRLEPCVASNKSSGNSTTCKLRDGLPTRHEPGNTVKEKLQLKPFTSLVKFAVHWSNKIMQ